MKPVTYKRENCGALFCLCLFLFFFFLTAKKPDQISQSGSYEEGRFSFSFLLYLIWGLSFLKKSYFLLSLYLCGRWFSSWLEFRICATWEFEPLQGFLFLLFNLLLLIWLHLSYFAHSLCRILIPYLKIGIALVLITSG